MSPALSLLLVVALAFTVEAALGFGATVIAVSLGSLFLPLTELLPAFVPLNIGLSAWLTVKNRRHADRRLLGAQILPAMLLGLPLGILAFRHMDQRVLLSTFAVFVLCLSAAEAVALIRTSAPAPRPLPRAIALSCLALAGAIHGAFATGGPLVVWVTGRSAPDKASFRATLSVLWLVLGIVLTASYVQQGVIGGASLEKTALLFPALLVGLAAGEVAHRKLPARLFRALVTALLAVSAVMLLYRS